MRPSSYDIIGEIAVFELPPKANAGKIAKEIMKRHPNIRTVCVRTGKHSGKYRIRPIKVVAGKRNTETIHKESGVLLKMDISKVYFTPRYSHEREIIASRVRPGETVGVFFAGIGPFALVILKKQPKVKEIYAVELNPVAYKYLEENIRINRAGEKVIPIKADIKKLRGSEKFDRVIAPIPKHMEEFFSYCIKHVKKKGILHYYSLGTEEKPFEQAERFLKSRKVKIVQKRVVRPYAPGIVQVCLELRIF
jgi:tRNA (guanine37-N1)-methyltransferase